MKTYTKKEVTSLLLKRAVKIVFAILAAAVAAWSIENLAGTSRDLSNDPCFIHATTVRGCESGWTLAGPTNTGAFCWCQGGANIQSGEYFLTLYRNGFPAYYNYPSRQGR